MQRSCAATFVCLVAAAGAAAQSMPLKAAPKQVQAPARPPRPSAQSDAAVEAAIRAKFAKSKINGDKFQVHVQGGVATIDGKTDVLQHKGAATRMAKSAGALSVRNRIQLSDAAKQRASANLAEGRRRAQISRGTPRSEPRGAARSANIAPKAAPPVRPRPGTSANASGTAVQSR
jgi:osmotically-inducible protein OsmY